MDYSLIGKKIKELRKIVGLTQGELAEGICTQALISRMEKGDIYPSATALYQISKKLGVDVNYFFEIGTTPRLDYIKEVERQLRKLRIRLQYEEMMEMVKAEEKNPIFFKDDYNLQLLLWHRGIYTFEIQQQREKAIAIFYEAFHLTYDSKKALSEREMEILLSIGALELTGENYEKALDIYNKVQKGLRMSDQLIDKSIKTRMLYNMARVHTRLGNYEVSTERCKEAIKWCIEEENLYGLGQLHYHIGYNYELEGKFSIALDYIEKSLVIFEMVKDEKYIPYLRDKKEEILSKQTQQTL
ncbi:helix-turn-helix transcriptional regulator [Rossellomorea aquimaris]|uniref:helix-turn-helix domain-containing protein n=1 Tax=Rossellomorea aquimaris TaxID=189382 RepID=UPI001CD7E7C1|nr:helix-turn-helix domain-containing protein [Rossellomorea aquimaris]MCA1055281.1 helix-turn-helix transcriptional regulator [Rossellomorea aquimaris]